jgi:hypothetical protein
MMNVKVMIRSDDEEDNSKEELIDMCDQLSSGESP